MSRITCLCAIIVFLGVSNGVLAAIQNKGWWRNKVFYQVYPRSFMDTNQDGIGDLKGITKKLKHFYESGIDGIWLSPIYASPMVDFGYDISDFMDIDPIFGTMEDLENLTYIARQLGIKVIMDLVPNHTSDQHVWFKKSLAGEGKYKDYYIWKYGKQGDPPNNWISVFSGPAWNYTSSRNQWYLHQFESRQPDLNYNNPEVQYEMKEVIKFWLRKGIDGFRVDAIPFLFEHPDFPDEPRSNDPNATPRDHAYLTHIYTQNMQRTYETVASWRKVMDDYADLHNEDEKLMMTEAYSPLDETIKYYRYGSHMPFNFKFITDVNKDSTAADFQKVIVDWMSRMPATEVPNWVMGNHDQARLESRYPGRGDHMIMLEMILPGIAVTYNGEEIGMMDNRSISWEDTQDPQACNAGKDKYAKVSRDPNRTPFQWDDTKNAGFSDGDHTWLPVHENYREVNLANQKVAKESPYKLYTSLTKLRRASIALQEGSLRTLVMRDNKVLIVIRKYDDKQSVTLLINFDQEKIQFVNLAGQGLRSKHIVEIASPDSPLKPGTILNTDAMDVPLSSNAALVLVSKD